MKEIVTYGYTIKINGRYETRKFQTRNAMFRALYEETAQSEQKYINVTLLREVAYEKTEEGAK